MGYDEKTNNQLKAIKQLTDQLHEIAHEATPDTYEIMHIVGCMDLLMYRNSAFFKGS